MSTHRKYAGEKSPKNNINNGKREKNRVFNRFFEEKRKIFAKTFADIKKVRIFAHAFGHEKQTQWCVSSVG